MAGNFHRVTYKVTPCPAIKKLTKEELKKRRLGSKDKEFQLNRVVDSTLFSPTIQLALPNLKRDYPGAFYN
jgi:hypothetical protein